MKTEKEFYVKPSVEVFYLERPLNLLIELSLEADVEDWDDLGEI